ncbi:MAG: ImmA/IrrE family metallo-endopeptidase [Solobacterium sp.]|nr:ImmA/IrrE family metallo-endopeptidase [Solobacterium sp.]
MNAYSFQSVFQTIEEGVRRIQDSGQYKEYLNVMTKFHTYSFNNVMLIYRQNPDATFVAGYHAWRRNFSRHVKKGERGIRILAPVGYRNKDPFTGEESMKIGFRMTTVFDISQTEGKPLPSFEIPRLRENIDDFEEVMKVLRLVSPVPVVFLRLNPSVHGYYSRREKKIVLNETMGESQTVKTLIHEIAHALVHDNEEETEEKDPAVREIEAESIAYSVCRYYGLDTSEFSFPYLAVFSRTKLNLQKDSMSLIQKTASQLITRINALEGIGPAEFGEGISAEEEAGQILEWN